MKYFINTGFKIFIRDPKLPLTTHTQKLFIHARYELFKKTFILSLNLFIPGLKY